MKNMNNEYKNMTMAELEAAIDEMITAWNECDNESDKVSIQLELMQATAEFDKMSLLHTYAVCLDAETPVVEFIQTRTSRTLKANIENVEDIDPATNKTRHVRTMQKVEGAKKMYLIDFLTWADKKNKSVTADKNWSVKVSQARTAIIDEWKRFFSKDSDTILSKNKAKTILQEMFDAIVFIPTEKGENAVIANGDAAKVIIAVANELKESKNEDGSINFEVQVLGKKKWNNLVTDIMYMAIKNKSYTIVYGDPEKAAK